MNLFSRRHVIRLGAAASMAPFLSAHGKATGGKRLGVALLGLGDYATKQLGPALKETRNARLTGIVTGSPEKISRWQKEYDIPDKNVYNYENFDSILDNKDIDIVYVVTPTGLHPEFSIRAAKAGKHVICEKPMAPTVGDCTRMIDAAKAAGVTLQIGYRRKGNHLRVEVERGRIEIAPAYGYSGQKGKTPDGPMNFPPVNQQALQIDGQVEAILRNIPSRVPGEMGRRDIQVIRGIMEAADSGKPYKFGKF